MTREEYHLYLQSDHWQLMRRFAHEANPGGGCRMCGSLTDLEVHHRTYVRCPYNERLEDLTVVCWECHQVFETAKKTNRGLATTAEVMPPPPVDPDWAPKGLLEGILDSVLKKHMDDDELYIIVLPDGRRWDTRTRSFVE